MEEPEPNAGSDPSARDDAPVTQRTNRLERPETVIGQETDVPEPRRKPSTTEASGRVPDWQAGDRTRFDPAPEVGAHFRRGYTYCQRGMLDEAIAAWRQVLLLQPANAYALANIGIAFTEQARWSEALDIFAQVLQLQPDNLDAQYGLGIVHAQEGRYQAAAAAWVAVLRLQPDNEDARRNLAQVRERIAAGEGCSAPAVQTVVAYNPVSQATADQRAAGAATRGREAGNGGTPQRENSNEPEAAPAPAETSQLTTHPAGTNALQPVTTMADIHAMRSGGTLAPMRNVRLFHTGLIASAVIVLVSFMAGFWLHPFNRHSSLDLRGATGHGTNESRANLPAPTLPPIQRSEGPVIDPGHDATSPLPRPSRQPDADLSRSRAAHALHRSFRSSGERPHNRSTITRSDGLPSRQRRHEIRRKITPAVSPPNAGYNQGIDKLLDRLP